MSTSSRLALISAALLVSCADAPPAPLARTHTNESALFVNSSFEAGNLNGWTLSTWLTATSPGVAVYPVTAESQLGLRSGGQAKTNVYFSATPFSSVPPGLSTAEPARYPRLGNYAAVVNEQGASNNANRITQSAVITTADVDPTDGLVHVRFMVLPVLQNPGHSLREQPYYFVSIDNTTRGTNLTSRFNFSNEAGVPWQSNAAGSVVFTDWLLFDLPMSRSAVSLGDTVTATIIAGGCAQGGHWGEAIIDGFGTSVPGLVVYGSGPDSVEAGADFQYTYRTLNGGGSAATGTRLTSYLPAGVTFRSVDTAGISCTTPTVGTRGTVACDLGSVPAGGSRVVKLTVRADATATGAIRHGWYLSQSNQDQPLTGPLVTTAVTTGGTTRYVDLVTTVDDATSSLTWGGHGTWSVTVRNAGPATATNAGLTTNAPTTLTNLAWTCTAGAGASCGAASGTGGLGTTASIGPGASVTWTVEADVITGSGVGSVNFTALATAPSGTVDSFVFDNGSGDEDSLSSSVVPVAITRAGSGSGALVSSPAGLECGVGCTSTSAAFASGAQVTVSAVPSTGSVFAGWSGGTCSGTGPCTFTVTSGQTLTGTFVPNPVAVTSPSTAKAAVGRPFSYTLSALGTAPLTLAVTGLPAWLSFDPATGILSGIALAAGGTTVTLSATDLNGTATQALVITAGFAPTITSALTWNITSAGTGWNSIDVNASGDAPVQFNASNLPGTVYFNSTSGTFAGSAGATGVFNVPVIATNAFGSDYKVLAVSVGGAPVITSALTSSTTVGTPWSYTLTATGAATLTLGASSLPAWASFTAATGVISGTPTRAGTLSIGLSAVNGVGSSNQTLVLTVDGPAAITSALTASGTAGQAFTYSLTAEGTAPLTRGVSGLPAWLSFDAASGLLSGTPPAAGTFTVTLEAGNSLGSDSQTLTLTVVAPPPTPTPPSITSALTANGTVGLPFAYAIAASGQVPMSFSATGLPAWASVDAAGVITGTPSFAGSVSLTLGATNTLGSDSQVLVLTIAQPPAITSSLTASAIVGDAFVYTLTATGAAPLTLSASGLPAWASFDASTGVLFGTPTADGAFSIALGASNPHGTDARSLAVTVRTPPAITSALSLEAVVGQPFSYALTATGTAPFTLAAGSLPAWASFDPNTGFLAGVPSSDVDALVTLTVTNLAGADSKSLAITVRALPVITSPLSANAVVGRPFSYLLTAVGTGPLSFSAASLPAWLSFDAQSGLLTGTPIDPGTASLSLDARNAAGRDNRVLVITTRVRPNITSALRRAVVVGETFSWPLTTTGTAPLQLTLDGLPAWLSFDAITGVLTGVPLADGSTRLLFSVSNEAGSATAELELVASTRPAITNPLLVVGVAGRALRFTWSASGTRPLVFSAANLPPGLALVDDVVSGTPSAAGRFSVTESVSNPAGLDAVTVVFDLRASIPVPQLASPAEDAAVPNDQVLVSGSVPAEEAGNTVRLSEGEVVLCEALVAADGSWSCVAQLAEGAHQVSAVLVDVRGLVGEGVDTQRFTVDLTAPLAPSWLAPGEGALLSTARPQLSGRGEPGAQVIVTHGGELVCAALVAPDGSWTCTPAVPLPEGEVVLSLLQRDAADHQSPVATRTLRLDTLAPGSPSITAPLPGARLNETTPAVTGHAEPLSTVTISVDGWMWCTTTADATGFYSCASALPLTEGAHTVTVSSSDAAGNRSELVTCDFSVDSVTPEAPLISSPSGMIVDATPTLTGQAEAGSTVTVWLDGALACTTVADAQGAWSCAVSAPLAEGAHTLTALARDAAGNESSSTRGDFEVQTASGTVEPPPALSSTENGQLSGTATPGATVNIYVDGRLVGSTTAGADGSWSWQLALLGPGKHQVSIGVLGSTGAEVFHANTEVDVRSPSVDFGGGLGCSSTSQGPLGLLALLALVLLSRRRAALVVPVVAALVSTQALAQVAVSNFELEQLVLNPSARGGLVVGGADLLAPGDFRFAASLGYQNAPLKYFEDGALRSIPVEHRLTATLTAGASVLDWLELGVTVPVVLYQGGAPASSASGELVMAAVPSSASLGTPWLQGRVAVLQERNGAPLDLGFTVMLGLPLGSGAALTRESTVAGQLLAGAGRTVGPVRLAAEVGAHLRTDAALAPGEAVGSRLLASVGASTVGARLRGELSLRAFAPLTHQPASAELLAGVRYALRDWELFALAGPGFGNAPGTPVFRAVLGLSFGGLTSSRWGGRAEVVAEAPREEQPVAPSTSLAAPAEAGPETAPPERSRGTNGVEPTSAPQVELTASRLELRGAVYFESARAVVQARSFALLDEVAAVLEAHPEVKQVNIEGHTDDRGDAARNLALSDARARAVKAYLVKAGVQSERLGAMGLGPSRPLAPNATPEGREQNRRVEFIVLQ